MSRAMEDLYNNAKMEQKEEVAERLLKQGMLSIEQIAECVEIDIETVVALAEDMQ